MKTTTPEQKGEGRHYLCRISGSGSSAVRRALNEIAAEAREERISRNDAARRVVELVDRLGLQPVRVDEVPAEIGEDDLGVVCWMVVLPATS